MNKLVIQSSQTFLGGYEIVSPLFGFTSAWPSQWNSWCRQIIVDKSLHARNASPYVKSINILPWDLRSCHCPHLLLLEILWAYILLIMWLWYINIYWYLFVPPFSFDDFLMDLKQPKRKNIRQERKKVCLCFGFPFQILDINNIYIFILLFRFLPRT